MNNLTKIALGALSAALMATTLGAQDIKFGGQASLALPTGPLGSSERLDSKLGGGLGAHAFIGLNHGLAVVPRVDYTYLKNSDQADLKVQTLQAGADCNYFFTGKANAGLYAGLGAGFSHAKFQATGVDDSTNRAYGAAQVGYMFTPRYGAELRYTYTDNKPVFNGVEQRIASPVLNASFVCHF